MIDRNTDKISEAVDDIKRQLSELKSLQLNGSSNNYSGIRTDANTFTYSPPSTAMTGGFRVRLEMSEAITLSTIHIKVVHASNNQPYSMPNNPYYWYNGFYFRRTKVEGGNFINYWSWIIPIANVPQLKIDAFAITNGDVINIRTEAYLA